MSVLPVVWPDRSVAVPVGVRVPAAVLGGRFVRASRLGTLLDRVHALSGGKPLTRLDASYLVDFDRGLRGVLYVDVDQGRVVRHLLIGQRQSVHGVRGGLGSLVASILVALGGGSGWLGHRQVAKLPRGVGRTPAQVPADAAASAEARYLTEEKSEALVLLLLLLLLPLQMGGLAVHCGHVALLAAVVAAAGGGAHPAAAHGREDDLDAVQVGGEVGPCWRQDIVELSWLLAATAGSVVFHGVRVALSVSVPVPVPLLDAVSVGAGQSVGGDGPRGRRVAFDRARSPALLGGGVRGSPSHLGHGVNWLPGGCRSWGLDLGGIDSLVGGPSLRLVPLERVGPWLNPPQTASFPDVHLLRSHLLTAGPLEAGATHAGMRPTAGAAVLAGGLAVRFYAAIGSRSQSPARAALMASADIRSGESPGAGRALPAALPAVHFGSVLLLLAARVSGGAQRNFPRRCVAVFPVAACCVNRRRHGWVPIPSRR